MARIVLIKTSLRRYTFDSKKMKSWAEKHCFGKTLNLFAGKNRLCCDEFRVDLSNEFRPDFVGDAYDFISSTRDNFDSVLLDPPYAYRKAMEMYNGNYTSRFRLIADEIKRKKIQRVISFGYHTTFMGIGRGYNLDELCVFAHGGAQHATIGIVENAF